MVGQPNHSINDNETTVNRLEELILQNIQNRTTIFLLAIMDILPVMRFIGTVRRLYLISTFSNGELYC